MLPCPCVLPLDTVQGFDIFFMSRWLKLPPGLGVRLPQPRVERVNPFLRPAQWPPGHGCPSCPPGHSWLRPKRPLTSTTRALPAAALQHLISHLSIHPRLPHPRWGNDGLGVLGLTGGTGLGPPPWFQGTLENPWNWGGNIPAFTGVKRWVEGIPSPFPLPSHSHPSCPEPGPTSCTPGTAPGRFRRGGGCEVRQRDLGGGGWIIW